jgi:hypothetical protein
MRHELSSHRASSSKQPALRSLLRELTISGTGDEVRSKVETYAASGV